MRRETIQKQPAGRSTGQRAREAREDAERRGVQERPEIRQDIKRLWWPEA
jgi:hypothetical protein